MVELGYCLAGIDDEGIVRCDHHRRTAGGNAGQHLDQDGRAGAIERRGRFVEDDQFGIAGQCAGYGEPLLLATREVTNTATTGRREADGLENLVEVVVSVGRRFALTLLRGPAHVGSSIEMIEQVLAWLGKHDPSRSRRSSRRSRLLSISTSVSPIFTLPSSGRWVHANSDNSVDLPDPDGPATTVISPNRISRST